MKRKIRIVPAGLSFLWSEFSRLRIPMAGLTIVGVTLFVALFVPLLPIPDPWKITHNVYSPPSLDNPFGTDQLGRSVLSRLLWGTRAALLVGLGSAGLSASLGILIGAIAGWYGKLTDDAISRVLEIFLVIPVFFMLIVLVAFYGASITIIMIGIGLTSWPRNARLMRAQVLSIKTRPFVQASIGIGAGGLRILLTRVIPNGVYPVLANATLEMGGAILVEAGLSFLGLGDPNVVSWGKMIYEGRESLGEPWMILFPGLAMIIFVCGLNLVGDGINFTFNRKLGMKSVHAHEKVNT